MPNKRCQWYLSGRAVREFTRMVGLDAENDEAFDRAEDLLVEVVRTARFHGTTDRGLQEWRASIPSTIAPRLRDRRIQLIVSTKPRREGDLPQLVSVLRRGMRGPDQNR